MAIRLIDEYPTRVDPASEDYPHGKGRNKSAPDAVDGTPYDQKRFNDHEALFQALWEAAGITPNGTVDTVPDNQTMDALVTVANGFTEVDVAGDQDVTLDFNQSRVAGIRLTGALAGNIDVIVPDAARSYVVINETSGDFSITVKTAAGSGEESPQGTIRGFDCDGTDVTRRRSSADDVDYSSETVKSALDNLTGGFTTKAIGETFNLSTHLTGVTEPDNSGSAKFVKLTAGLDGAGQFNEGLLTNEAINGSGPTIEVTAEIATGPLAGNVINLLNSENRYLMPGENSGAAANDQMQQITGEFNEQSSVGSIAPLRQDSGFDIAGAFVAGGDAADGPSGGGGTGTELHFDSANSPDARTGDHTNVKHAQATYYMRIA